MVIVLQDLNLVLRYCDKFMLLKNHRMHAYGDAEVVTKQSIEEVYGIAVHIRETDSVKIVVPQS